jgi:hypothetical protein
MLKIFLFIIFISIIDSICQYIEWLVLCKYYYWKYKKNEKIIVSTNTLQVFVKISDAMMGNGFKVKCESFNSGLFCLKKYNAIFVKL